MDYPLKIELDGKVYTHTEHGKYVYLFGNICTTVTYEMLQGDYGEYFINLNLPKTTEKELKDDLVKIGSQGYTNEVLASVLMKKYKIEPRE